MFEMEENLKVMNCFFGINRDTKHNEYDWEFCLRCCLAKVNGDIDARFLPQSELTRARNGVSYCICNSSFTINVRQWYNNR